MTLLEIIRDLESFSEDDTIYASEPWIEESTAAVLREPDDGALPSEANQLGAVYFLEIFTAREIMKDFPTTFTLEDKCARLIRYARDDA